MSPTGQAGYMPQRELMANRQIQPIFEVKER